MEIITRAVAINDGRILAARQRNRPWYFLPGGHVEPGEAIQAALARELVEELSTEAQIGRLIGVVEHAYAEDGTDHHELNLVFEVTLPTSEITSREDHLDFTWLAVTDLAVTDLRPGRLKEALLTWTETGDRFWRGRETACRPINHRSAANPTEYCGHADRRRAPTLERAANR